MGKGLRIKQLREAKNLTQEELARLLDTKRQTISKYEKEIVTNIPSDRIERMAEVLDTTPEYILGWEKHMAANSQKEKSIPGIEHPTFRSVPLLGEIACGEPITAAENLDGNVQVDGGVHCDFALRCKGDSMAPRLLDGDLVFIRQQPSVDNGQIAAVLIDTEATLKHVYVSPSSIQLVAENPAYAPIVLTGDEAENARILGKAVAYRRNI